MPAGKVKWFNNAKGFGFIVSEGVPEDIFVHYSAVQMDGYKTLKAGQPVAFDTVQAERGVHASNVLPCRTEQESLDQSMSLAENSASPSLDAPDGAPTG